jgi:hypothetical protein
MKSWDRDILLEMEEVEGDWGVGNGPRSRDRRQKLDKLLLDQVWSGRRGFRIRYHFSSRKISISTIIPATSMCSPFLDSEYHPLASLDLISSNTVRFSHTLIAHYRHSFRQEQILRTNFHISSPSCLSVVISPISNLESLVPVL